jgi:hypothetical protein
MPARVLISTRLAQAKLNRLNNARARAAARATQKGRSPPKRDDDNVYYDHWGYPYLYTAPYAYPLWWTPGMYYGWSPGYVVACGSGVSCVAGTCGGTVSAGGCGGAGVSFPFLSLLFCFWGCGYVTCGR